MHPEVIATFQAVQNVAGILYVKLGMDGASSQSIYNQKYENTDLEEAIPNEESLFLTSITPLKLVMNEKDIWVNATPSSCHFTRPIHLQYKKETKEVTNAEEQSLRQEMENLHDYDLVTSLHPHCNRKKHIGLRSALPF